MIELILWITGTMVVAIISLLAYALLIINDQNDFEQDIEEFELFMNRKRKEDEKDKQDHHTLLRNAGRASRSSARDKEMALKPQAPV